MEHLTQQPRRVLSLSFVLPCLNEAQSLPVVLATIQELQRTLYTDRPTEVIVADNGSTDGSPEIARRFGATVISCPLRGYGAALQCGIRAARYEAVVFADADNTYDLRETPRLVEALEDGADLVLGSRLRGTIEPGAMPLLHRYLGTPVLNLCINLLYSRGRQRITDCNSGFRCARRERFTAWGVRSTGMEFASEMLVRALASGASIREVPITLRRDWRDRTPHLQTWRDGMRHLLQILLGAPQFFSVVGVSIFVISWAITLIALFFGPLRLGPVSIFGIHTMMFALLGSHVGLTLWGIGLLLTAQHPRPGGVSARLLTMREDRLFWSLTAFSLASLGMLLWILGDWGRQGFQTLSLERQTLALITAASNGLVIASQLIGGHLLKRT